MVGDSNRFDGSGEFLGLGHVGSGLVHDSHVVSVMLYKLDRRGVPDSSSSGVTQLAQISSLRFQSKLEY